MGVGGLLLRLSSTILHGITILTTVFVLAIYAYFIDKLRHDSLPIDGKWEAVLGISAAAALWSLLALVFTLCLGGVKILAWVGTALDIAFAGATVAVIVHTDNGRHSCSNGAFADTPVGSGTVGDYRNGNQAVLDGKATINLKTACDLQKAAFSVAIATSILFLLAAIFGYLLYRHKANDRHGGYNGKARNVEFGGNTTYPDQNGPTAMTSANNAPLDENQHPGHHAQNGNPYAPSPAQNF